MEKKFIRFKLAEQDGVSEASYNISLLKELIQAQ